MIATAIPHASLPLKAADTNQRAELTSAAMAESHPPPSCLLPRPFNRSRRRVHVTTAQVSTELGALDSTWYASSRASIVECVAPRASPASFQAGGRGRQRSLGDATQQNELCRCTIHPAASAVLFLPPIALSWVHRSRQVSSGKAPSR